MMPTGPKDTYLVRLNVFEGPLDLLLHLIEREKLDISTISLAQVADQFLAFIQDVEMLHPATLADFLAMAARLVCLKSRLLLPRPARGEEDEEEEPGEALARQLREYKRFKEAAGNLAQILARGQRAYVRLAAAPELERRLSSNNVTWADFLAAVRNAFLAKPAVAPVDTVVAPFTLTIHDQIRMIVDATRSNQIVTFRSLLQAANNRLEIIVTLLAVLELLKRRRVTVEQSAMFGEILIVHVPGVSEEDNGAGTSDDSGI